MFYKCFVNPARKVLYTRLEKLKSSGFLTNEMFKIATTVIIPSHFTIRPTCSYHL